jgi:anti-anti-sigma factor
MSTGTSTALAPAGATFQCHVHPARDAVVVAPVGELDLATVPLLDAELRQLREAGFMQLVLDLRGLSFLDSSGVQLLLMWHSRALRRGHAFTLIPGSERIQRVLALTGVVDHLSFDAP